MTQNEISYMLQGHKSHAELVKETREKIKDISPDISKAKYRVQIGKTLYFPKSKKRYKKLLELKNKLEK